MATYAEEFFNHFDDNWEEIDMLIDLINSLEDEDPKLKTYCRILSVLMVANLEGYLTEVIRTLIKDINYHKFFCFTNNQMKRTYCLQFIPDGKGSDKRIAKLIEMLDTLEVKYNEAPFLFESSKNPKVSIIEKLFSKVCSTDFWGHICGGDIDDVFQNNIEDNEKYILLLKGRIKSGVSVFPYNIDKSDLGFNNKTNKINKESLWSMFIDEILKNRHQVAHGMNYNFTMNRNVIREQKEKIIILELLFTILVFEGALSRR